MRTVDDRTMTGPSGTAGWRVPFHVAQIDDEAVDAVVRVLRSGWLTTGQQCRDFEAAFASVLGPDVHAVAVNSATAALHLGLEALGVDAGSRVITTPYTFAATAEVVRHLGAEPVFADVDPVTGNLTPQTVMAAYQRLSPTERRQVRALVPVHFAGLPCDMTGLARLAGEHGWGLLDDAAHALPASHRGQAIGTLGDVTAFSFYVTKPLCTGEGGMAVTRDPDLARRMRTMRLHGIDRDVFDRYHRADAWYYEVVAAGFKYNLTDVAAALGLVQLRRLRADHAARRAIAAAYRDALGDVEGLRLPPEAHVADEHAWHLFALRVTDGPAVRSAFVRHLAATGVGASVHFIPLHLQPYYRDRYHLRPDDFPAATGLYHEEVSLPIWPGMTTEHVRWVVEAVPAALAAAREETAPSRPKPTRSGERPRVPTPARNAS
ncbi:DegT/DnrJ/EryC1/StrS family aminotransferase [Egicoccus sp. AB-alg2]|uniref:DegT/DnrJ/EryC1/StrS family aminotransferase n=1 Tax=Egicoccus sp. AB-alg2 TaxID=3242693 RepID=UPI00359D14D7